MKKLIFVISFIVVFGLLFNVGAPTVKAATAEELQAQINQLLATLNTLRAQLAVLQGQTEVWCHDFNANLKIGDSGSEVQALQTALSKEGLYMEEIAGTFDEYTASAVVAFQEKYASEILTSWGLTHGTGYVGLTTRAKLKQIYGCTALKPVCQNLWWYDTGHQYCQQNQFCGAFMYLGLYTFGTEAECKAALGQPSIGAPSLLSPSNGATVYEPSRDVLLQWKEVAGATKYRVEVAYDTAFSQITQGAIVTSTSWTTTKRASGVTHYWRVRVEEPSPGQWSEVWSWVIQTEPATSTPSITVLSPNGGERWTQGQTYQVTWQRTNFNDEVAINLIDYTSGSRYGMQYGITNGTTIRTVSGQTSFSSWTIPTSIPVGDYYKVSIGSGSVNDFSDNYFSIVATTTPSCGDLTCTYLIANSLATLQKYDTDKNGQISLSEELACVNGWNYGTATADEFCSILNAWKKGCTFSTAPSCTFSIQGYVKEQTGGDIGGIISGATVAVDGYSAVSDSQGFYEMKNLPCWAGTQYLQASKTGYVSMSSPIPVTNPTGGVWILNYVLTKSSLGLEDIGNQLADISKAISALMGQINKLLGR